MKAVMLGFACLAATPALAAPTYLVCNTVDGANRPQQLRVIVDVELKTGAVVYPDGREDQAPATVTEQAIGFTFVVTKSGALRFTSTYVIDRETLKLTRRTAGNTMLGQCALADPPSRAF